jgi:rRNA maturation endonuclease Nob1
MGLANCPECGKLYLENPSGVCAACYVLMEADEIKVADFLREKRKASLQEIHEGTGVRIKVILRMINQNRVTGDFEVSYPCETCGVPIEEGRICDKCSKNVLDQVKPQFAKKPAEATEQGKRQDRVYLGDRFHKQ